MDGLNQISNTIALTMGVAWASGINLYAAILTLGILNSTGNIDLPANLLIVSNPLVMIGAGVMFAVEFFADKIPGIDTTWDSIHTFIRIPAGALLAAGAVGDVSPAVAITAGILGGGLAAGTHATKAGSRVLINASPEPFTNWAASFAEDFVVIAGIWTALHHPWLFIVFIIVFLLLMVWLIPKILGGIKNIYYYIVNIFKKQGATTPLLNSTRSQDKQTGSDTNTSTKI
jgi:hypothetical protein